MEITRTINDKPHTFTLTESELWEAWQEVNTWRERNYIISHIEENYADCIDSKVYDLLKSDDVVDEIYEEAHFRAECGWGSFEAEADMLIESKLEELEADIAMADVDLTENEEE